MNGGACAGARFARGDTRPAMTQIRAFQQQLYVQRGKRIPDADADAILEELGRIRGCLRV